MINDDNDIESLLKKLGDRLREARLSRNESQELFAQRVGVTRQSYSKMEKGHPRTPIENWLVASSLLDRLEGWEEVLAPPEDLFAEFARRKDQRRRAGRKRKGK